MLSRELNGHRMCEQCAVPAFRDRDVRRRYGTVLSGPGIDGRKESSVCFGNVLIAESWQPSENPKRLRHFLLEGCCLKTAHDAEVLFLKTVPQVSRSLVVVPRIKDLEFHLSEVMHLQKTALEGRDNARSPQRDEEFFDRIEINDSI